MNENKCKHNKSQNILLNLTHKKSTDIETTIYSKIRKLGEFHYANYLFLLRRKLLARKQRHRSISMSINITCVQITN